MSKNYQIVNNLKISDELLSFVNKELLQGLDSSFIELHAIIVGTFIKLLPFCNLFQLLKSAKVQWH